MFSDIGKNRVHRLCQKLGFRVTSALENKFSYDRENFDVGESPVIFDIGANIGQSSLWFRSSFPDAVIHSFEPFRAVFGKLQASVSNPCHNFALGAENATLNVPSMDDPYEQTGSLKNYIRSERTETIEVRTVDGFCEGLGIERIDILKTDTEGYEIEVLTGAKRMLAEGSIGYILAEATLISKNHTHLFELNEFLSPHGYSLISILDIHHAGNGAGLKYCNALFKQTSGRDVGSRESKIP